jgi:hypothetical protein
MILTTLYLVSAKNTDSLRQEGGFAVCFSSTLFLWFHHLHKPTVTVNDTHFLVNIKLPQDVCQPL